MLHTGTNESDELVRQFGNPCPLTPPQQPDYPALESFDVFSISKTFLLKTNKCETFLHSKTAHLSRICASKEKKKDEEKRNENRVSLCFLEVGKLGSEEERGRVGEMKKAVEKNVRGSCTTRNSLSKKPWMTLNPVTSDLLNDIKT